MATFFPPKPVETYWIKVNLHKDNTPLWHGVIGEKAKKLKIAELKALGYNPTVEHTI
jgi:hypothetical protein